MVGFVIGEVSTQPHSMDGRPGENDAHLILHTALISYVYTVRLVALER